MSQDVNTGKPSKLELIQFWKRN